MTKQEAPTQSPKYVPLSPAELNKVLETRRRHTEVEVEPEWLFIAEFGCYYGWGGVQAILDNEILNSEAVMLMHAARKVFYKQNYHQANGTFVATLAATRSKRPVEAFNDGMKSYRKASR